MIADIWPSKALAGQGMRDNMMLSSNRDLLEAAQLQDLWCSLSLKHVSLEGGRCSCGREHVTLRLTDFEEDIGEYLYDDAARGQRQDINAFLRAHGRDAETGRWNIDRLVRLLARAEPKLGLTADSGCVGREAAAHHRIFRSLTCLSVSKINRSAWSCNSALADRQPDATRSTETTRVHHAPRRCGGVAARGTCAAADETADYRVLG